MTAVIYITRMDLFLAVSAVVIMVLNNNPTYALGHRFDWREKKLKQIKMTSVLYFIIEL